MRDQTMRVSSFNFRKRADFFRFKFSSRSRFAKITVGLVCYSIVISNSFVVAAPSTVQPAAPLAAAPTVFHLNPETLRNGILKSNTSVLSALNAVYQAKTSVSAARASVIPGLSVTGAVQGGQGFALTTVSILLPFLLPSNWFNLDAHKKQLAAAGYAYHIVELNTYASALALELTVQGDLKMRDVYKQQLDNLQAIEDLVADKVLIGTEATATLDQAKSQTNAAAVALSGLDERIAKERASLAQMLGLTAEQEKTFVIDSYEMQTSANESTSVQQLINQLGDSYPELRQIKSLIQASEKQKWAGLFGIVSSASLSETASTSGSLGAMKGLGTVVIGAGTFPALDLSNLGIAGLEIQSKAVERQTLATLEATLDSIAEAKKQLQYSAQAIANSSDAYEEVIDRYRLGTTDFLNVLQAENALVTVEVSQINVETDLETLRVGLNRALISNEFAAIAPCKLSGAERTGGVVGFLTDIFDSAKHTTIDNVCKVAPSAAAIASGTEVKVKKEKKKKHHKSDQATESLEIESAS